MTDMPFPLYGPGIYEGLRKYSALGVPLYITETGIPDYKEDRREEMFNTYFPQVLYCGWLSSGLVLSFQVQLCCLSLRAWCCDTWNGSLSLHRCQLHMPGMEPPRN